MTSFIHLQLVALILWRAREQMAILSSTPEKYSIGIQPELAAAKVAAVVVQPELQLCHNAQSASSAPDAFQQVLILAGVCCHLQTQLHQCGIHGANTNCAATVIACWKQLLDPQVRT